MVDLEAIERLCAEASPGPWRSLRDGNQYLGTSYMPTARLVGASKLEGVLRPWNPHAYVAHGFRPAEFETARFRDEDADFIAQARDWLPAMASELRELRQVVENCHREIERLGVARLKGAYERDAALARVRELEAAQAVSDAANKALAGKVDEARAVACELATWLKEGDAGAQFEREPQVKLALSWQPAGQGGV